MEIVPIFSNPGETLQAVLMIDCSRSLWDILSLFRVLWSLYRCVINDVIGDDDLACTTFSTTRVSSLHQATHCTVPSFFALLQPPGAVLGH